MNRLLSDSCNVLFDTCDVRCGQNMTLDQTGQALNKFLFEGDEVLFIATLVAPNADIQV